MKRQNREAESEIQQERSSLTLSGELLPGIKSPVLCGAEEGDPGVEDFVFRGRRKVHGFREAGEE